MRIVLPRYPPWYCSGSILLKIWKQLSSSLWCLCRPFFHSNRIGQPTCRPAPKTSPTTTTHQAQSLTHCRQMRHLTLPSLVVISSTVPWENQLPRMALVRGQVFRWDNSCVHHGLGGQNRLQTWSYSPQNKLVFIIVYLWFYYRVVQPWCQWLLWEWALVSCRKWACDFQRALPVLALLGTSDHLWGFRVREELPI